MKDVNHYIERADGSSRRAVALWDDDRHAYLIDCIERDTSWGPGYLAYVYTMGVCFKELTCSR
jgi:hypothetical protein